jgi:ABC-type Fe3+-hydroxamate transport system substrate-binding protein
MVGSISGNSHGGNGNSFANGVNVAHANSTYNGNGFANGNNIANRQSNGETRINAEQIKRAKPAAIRKHVGV